MRVQSVLFGKNHTVHNAIQWLKEHGYHHNKIDKTKHFLRFRQFNPIAGSRYRTITLPNNILLITIY